MIILSASILIAFSYSAKNSLKYFVYFALGLAGLVLILNSHLYSVLIVLITLLFFSAAKLLGSKVLSFTDYTEQKQPRVNLITVVVISSLAALLAGTAGSAKWKLFDINNDVNSYNLLFAKYLPLLIILALLASAVFGILSALKTGERGNI